MKKIIIFILAVFGFATTIYHRGYVDFKSIVNQNINGNIETIGNTVECVTNLKFAKSLDDINKASCSNDLNKNDNNYLVKYINVLDNNSSIFNSSTAVLKFPSSYKKIVWAALFWQGHINNYSYQYSFTNKRDKKGYDYYYDDQKYKDGHEYIKKYIDKKGKPYYKLSNDLFDNDYKNGIKKTSANKVQLYLNNYSYEITANEIDYKSNKRYFRDDKKKKWLTKYGVKYSAYAILSQSIINKMNSLLQKNSKINVTVANIFTTFGLDKRLGDYGAWSLVVIYQEVPDINNYRNINVYYGFKNIDKEDKQININIKGLILPNYGEVSSILSIFSAEGDYIYTGTKKYPESIRINNEYLYENLQGYDKNNVFDSRLSDDIQRYPHLINNNGIDIDVFDASKQMTEIRDKEKEENSSRVTYDVNIKASTYNDAVFISAIAFSTQLYVPKVCYYDLRLYKNNQLVTPATKLYVGDKIKVSLKIKNDENESAKNVYFIYPIDTNITKYINNSTYVKNVLSNNYINLKDNTSYKNLQVIFSNNVLSIGVLGDDKNEFLPFSINPEYVAGIEFNESIESEGKLSFKFYTDYNYTLGNSNYHYHGLLPNCNNMNNYYNTYTPQSGIFNVVHYQPNITFDPLDVNNSINDLYTQIVNKDNNFTLVHLGEDNQTLSSFVGVVKLDLIKNPTDETECKTNPSLKSIYVFMLDEDKYNFDFSYEKAIKNARFRVDYLYFPDNSCMKGFMYRVRNRFKNKFSDKELKGDFQNKEYHYEDLMSDEDFYKKCAPKCLNECYHGFSKCKGSDNCKKRLKKCLRCLFDKNEVKSVCSRDNFAIRPYKFEIVPITSPIKAGDEFNLTIKAVGYLGNPVEDYNETIVLKGLSSPDLNYIDLNTSKGCITGILSGKSLKFKNGIANLSLNYSEVGDLNLSIKENKDTEFAKVDEKDHNNSDLFIKQANTILKFIPYDFKVVSYFKNFNNGKFTYLSNDLNMSAIFAIELKVVNKQNQILQNYNSKCYAKNIQINASYTYNKNLNFPTYLFVKDDNNQTILKINSSKQTFEKELSKDYFKNFGLANIKIYLNFSKDYKTPVSSFEMNLTELNLSDKDINKTINNILSNVIFRYGRIAINDVVGYSNELNSTVKYEYWDDNKGWIVNKEHNSSIYGDINLTLSYYPNLKIQLGNIWNGKQNLTISTTHALPYSTKVHLAIPSWLWYHPLAKPYKNPKTSSGLNLDCLTHPCFSVSFQKNSKGWGGIESTSNAKYNEENRTVKSNSSIKINKDSLKKINW